MIPTNPKKTPSGVANMLTTEIWFQLRLVSVFPDLYIVILYVRPLFKT